MFYIIYYTVTANMLNTRQNI